MMKNKNTQNNHTHTDALDCYFKQARNQKCPSMMKQNLYQEIFPKKSFSWQAVKFAAVGLPIAFVAAMMLNMYSPPENQGLTQAQSDLAIAMHYMNRVSLKTLSAVSNDGIKPGLIKPLARSYAAL